MQCIVSKRIYVDRGYRGHDDDSTARVIIAGQKRGLTPTMRREQKRRNGIDAIIGHTKFDHRMERNHLLGTIGDAIKLPAATISVGFSTPSGVFARSSS